MKKAVAFEGVESSKTRGEGEGEGRCAIAIVCTLVPPATAKWSTVAHTVHKNVWKQNVVGKRGDGGKRGKLNHELRI